jgi:anhydro-N-acetylmuramic acid kinase
MIASESPSPHFNQLRRNRSRPGRSSQSWCVGLMSGTSMDSVDAALVTVSGKPASPQVELQAFASVPYPPALRERLLRVALGRPTTTGEISELNFLVGEAFAKAALAVCHKGHVDPRQLAVIGSHGQTIFHQGKSAMGMGKSGRRLATSSTLQIGEAAVIAERTGAPVVADFRTADMAAGGEGAPLVPLVDYLLFRDSEVDTVALNIGGIANVTVIPVGTRQEDVFGFDTGPGNMVMDELVQRATRGRERYDRDGRMASRGRIIPAILDEVLSLPFFTCRPPKSAGREQFGANFVGRYFKRRGSRRWNDLIRTAAELTAKSISIALTRFVHSRMAGGRLVISGGGAQNPLLLELLRVNLPGLSMVHASELGVPDQAKEAMAFALLADRTMQGRSGNLPRVTGARRAVVLGKIARP